MRAAPRRRLRTGLASLALVPILSGCTFLADIGGVVAGGVSGGATGNPAIGFVVGVGVRAGLVELDKYVSRVRHRGEQDAIADAAGSLPVGGTTPWEIRHTIPIGNRRGELLVADETATPLATCRTIVFSVQDGDERRLFTTTLCRQADRWKWAAAEPAVDRWGFLQ